MKSSKGRFWFNIVLFVLFILSVVSLAGEGNQVLTRVHYVAGTLMILGSAIHLVWHWQWIQKNVLRFPRQVDKATRTNRRIDIPLFVLFLLCGVSGLVVWLMEMMGLRHFVIVLSEWGQLHQIAGMLMSLLVLLHLGYHAKWVVCMARKSLSPTPPNS